MLPIRFITEGFGLEADRNSDEQTVTITKGVAEKMPRRQKPIYLK